MGRYGGGGLETSSGANAALDDRPAAGHLVSLADIRAAFERKPDPAGVLQGVRRLRQGVVHKRIVLMPSPKNCGFTIPCEGRLEALFAENLELSGFVSAYRVQPVAFPGPYGGKVVPDFAVRFVDGTYQVVDVKPHGHLNRPDVSCRMNWVRKRLGEARISHRVVTDLQLKAEPARTIRRQLRRGIRTKVHSGITELARSIVQHGPLPVRELRARLMAARHPALSVEKLIVMGVLGFDTSRPWNSFTLIGELNGPQHGRAGWGSIHSVLV